MWGGVRGEEDNEHSEQMCPQNPHLPDSVINLVEGGGH